MSLQYFFLCVCVLRHFVIAPVRNTMKKTPESLRDETAKKYKKILFKQTEKKRKEKKTQIQP